MRTGSSLASNAVISPTPLTPPSRLLQYSSTVSPIGLMHPSPVTTTRLPYILWLHLGVRAENDGRVVAAQSEGVAHFYSGRPLARVVRHVVKIALRVRCLVVDGRRQPARLERLDADQRLYRTCGAEQVAGHALGRGHR